MSFANLAIYILLDFITKCSIDALVGIALYCCSKKISLPFSMFLGFIAELMYSWLTLFNFYIWYNCFSKYSTVLKIFEDEFSFILLISLVMFPINAKQLLWRATKFSAELPLLKSRSKSFLSPMRLHNHDLCLLKHHSNISNSFPVLFYQRLLIRHKNMFY